MNCELGSSTPSNNILLGANEGSLWRLTMPSTIVWLQQIISPQEVDFVKEESLFEGRLLAVASGTGAEIPN
jgi:hypothetical protein